MPGLSTFRADSYAASPAAVRQRAFPADTGIDNPLGKEFATTPVLPRKFTPRAQARFNDRSTDDPLPDLVGRELGAGIVERTIRVPTSANRMADRALLIRVHVLSLLNLRILCGDCRDPESNGEYRRNQHLSRHVSLPNLHEAITNDARIWA
jgi:hypothetical protein